LSILSLNEFLNNKPLFYNKINYERMPLAFKELNNKINISLKKVIHIIGTNGKGSTGRYLSGLLLENKFTVAHYSSPHIFKFNERLWINGQDVSNEILEKYHKILYTTLDINTLNSLSYFEYTTLLSITICHFISPDFIILEAGLGGENDATNVINSDYTLITPIDFDHQDFLGNSIKEIATTKLNAIKQQAIISFQEHKEVYEISKNICKNKNIFIKNSDNILENYEKNINNILLKFIKSNNIASFQIENIKLALSTFIQIINKPCDINHNINLFLKYKMPFRCEKISDNIWVDVGHNILGATALKNYFLSKNQKIYLIYNSFSNKDYAKILSLLAPIINEILYINIDDTRMVTKDKIEIVAKKLDIKINKLTNINKNNTYLAFGSFLVIENFIKRFYTK
jgi:dihydrofolate synthase/folylpolyglutamate synthase